MSLAWGVRLLALSDLSIVSSAIGLSMETPLRSTGLLEWSFGSAGMGRVVFSGASGSARGLYVVWCVGCFRSVVVVVFVDAGPFG